MTLTGAVISMLLYLMILILLMILSDILARRYLQYLQEDCCHKAIGNTDDSGGDIRQELLLKVIRKGTVIAR
jgi:hypothetical protein